MTNVSCFSHDYMVHEMIFLEPLKIYEMFHAFYMRVLLGTLFQFFIYHLALFFQTFVYKVKDLTSQINCK